MRSSLWFAYAALFIGLLARAIPAAEPGIPRPAAFAYGGDKPLSFTHDVRPILAENCVLCHGPDAGQREAKLRLDLPDAQAGGWLADRNGFPAVVPGHPEDSELLARVTEEEEWRMPPPAHGPPLSDAQIATLERWISEGAPFEEHWAYAGFGEPTPAPSEGDFESLEHPIDAFVQRKLSQLELQLQPEEAPRALLRRVSLDLTGLPPTLEQLADFLQAVDTSAPEGSYEAAYERAVDQLLASDAYAEHWTSAWLDLARYADSHGYSIDSARSVWPWRDWVLKAIREDMPYDEFSVRQLAGDLLPGASNADRIATGFHRNTQVNQEGGAKDEENRINAVHDRVATTGAVWLGSTVACAQCHDHKYDAITQKDYYRLFAFYNSTADGGVTDGPFLPVASTEEEEQQVDAYERAVHSAKTQLDATAAEVARDWSTWVPTSTRTDNGPELVHQSDGSLLAVGQNPVTTAYELGGPVPLDGMAALRLEALPHMHLPARGPGRANNGNFAITGLRLETRKDSADEWGTISLDRAQADFEQDTSPDGGALYPAAAVLQTHSDERKHTSGWAIKPAFGQAHVLHVWLDVPIAAPGSDGSAELRVVIEQRLGSNHTLGHFRLLTLPADSGFQADSVDYSPKVPTRWNEAFNATIDAARERPSLPTSLVLQERWHARDSHLFRRGSFLDLGEQVQPNVPAAMRHLGPYKDPSKRTSDEQLKGSTATRLDLARWLVHPNNALVHRVTVNRWWQAFFGRGLVATENDFGLRGATPTHPELLEWLAQDFVNSGFSRKQLHRRIVTSRSYRQKALSHKQPGLPASLANDPANQLLGRQRRLRLTPEAIRDSALQASGLLSQRFGGPPVQPPQPDGIFAFTQNAKSWQASEGADRFRRTLYTRRWRSAVFPFLTTFDAPQPNVACTRRERTTSALQALTLANDPMMLELAAALGARALGFAEAAVADGQDPTSANRQALALAFELALGRPASEQELSVLLTHFKNVGTERDSSSESELTPTAEPIEANQHGWTAIGRVLFNLDEFVQRP